jgi:hypothetical protein
MIAQRSSHGAGRAIKRRIRSLWAGQPIGVDDRIVLGVD